MLFLKKVLSAIALFIAIQAYAQSPTSGDLILEDIPQIQDSTNAQNPSIKKRIIGFEKSTLALNHFNSIGIKVEDLKLANLKTNLLLVHNDSLSPPTRKNDLQTHSYSTSANKETFIYSIATKRTGKHFGKLIEVNEDHAILKINKKKTLIYQNNILEIILQGKRIKADTNLLTEYHLLTTKNGDKFIGQLLSYNAIEFIFSLKNGSELIFKRDELSSIDLRNIRGSSKAWDNIGLQQKDFNQQRLFLTPTALQLEKGASEFRTMIFYNTIEHGVSDNFTIGGGLSSVWVVHALTGKVKFGGSISEWLHVAIGIEGIYAFSFIEDFGSETNGVAYGSIALGSKNNFINLSIGRSSKIDHRGRRTGFATGGAFRINKRWRLFFEFIEVQEPDRRSRVTNNARLGTIGLNWQKNRHQLDFGMLAGIFSGGDFFGLPAIAYSIRF